MDSFTEKKPTVSVIMPVYNVEQYIAESIRSVLTQTFTNFEFLLIDDGGNDNSLNICQQFHDPRIKIIKQENRGLAGARNTGIRNARGQYLAFLDSDDLWGPKKLEMHVSHLEKSPAVGVSYSASIFIDDGGKIMGIHQLPKLSNVTARDVICRNPVGNGSAPVIRREVFQEIEFEQDLHGFQESAFFDENFRQSEDIECWVRIALQTEWVFEGLAESLTFYRVNTGGLSANLEKQFATWERMIHKASQYAPDFITQWGNRAKAYQLRYLARRAIRMRNAETATRLINKALITDFKIIFQEPGRTLITLFSAYLLLLLPKSVFLMLECQAMRLIGYIQNNAKPSDI
jgi:hypothetical protein